MKKRKVETKRVNAMDNKTRLLKKGLAIFVCIAMVSTAYMITSGNVKAASNRMDWMEVGNYFDYTTTINYTRPKVKTEMFDYEAEIVEVTETTIRFTETYVEGDTTLKFSTSYDIDTRRECHLHDYYSWMWINEDDIANGTVYLADKIATVENITPEYYILSIPESSRNKSTLYYSRSDFRLVNTADYRICDDLEANATATRVATGYRTSEQTKQSLNDEGFVTGVSNPNPSGSPTYYFYPPYYSGGRYYGGWGHYSHYWSAYSSWSAVEGKEQNYAVARGGPGGYGKANAYAHAELRGPKSGTFSVSKSGVYKIYKDYYLDGFVETLSTYFGWLGGGSSSGYIISKLRVFDVDTGYLVQGVWVEHWDHSLSGGLCFGCTWDHRWYQVSAHGHFYTGHTYYFKTILYTEHNAVGVGIGHGQSWSDLIETINYVKLSFQYS